MQEMKLTDVQRKARYGHRDWVSYVKDGRRYAGVATSENIKRAILSVGVHGHIHCVGENTGHVMRYSWPIAINWFNNLRYYEGHRRRRYMTALP